MKLNVSDMCAQVACRFHCFDCCFVITTMAKVIAVNMRWVRITLFINSFYKLSELFLASWSCWMDKDRQGSARISRDRQGWAEIGKNRQG